MTVTWRRQDDWACYPWCRERQECASLALAWATQTTEGARVALSRLQADQSHVSSYRARGQRPSAGARPT
eukprot:9044919-Pyramimonas_sp.AAC.1